MFISCFLLQIYGILGVLQRSGEPKMQSGGVIYAGEN